MKTHKTKCCFSIDYDNLNAEKVEVVNYNEKTNVTTLDLSGFVYEDFNVLDNIIDIPCHDPQDEYINIMINGYEGYTI